MTMSLTRVELVTATLAAPSVQPAPWPVAPDGPGGAPAEPAAALCRCGHDAGAHEHYRAGSDCGACGAAQCGRFRPAARTGLLRRWLRRR